MTHGWSWTQIRFVAVVVVAFASLSPPAKAEERTVNFYNWSNYMAPGVLEDFTRETGIKVVYDTFDANETLETRLLAGKSGYDVVVPTAYFLQRQITAKVFQTLDKSIETILKTGATPLACLCFKPHLLFPDINQDIVEPTDYETWDQLIFELVKHYRDRQAGIRYHAGGLTQDVFRAPAGAGRATPSATIRSSDRSPGSRSQRDAIAGRPAGWRLPWGAM